MKTTRFCLWLLVGIVAAAVACSNGSGGSPGQTGGAGSGGISASGGKNNSGGANASGGATGGQNSGGYAGDGGGGSGGGTLATGTGGGPNATGGQGVGGAAGNSATGGKAAGGSAGSGGAQMGGNPGAGGVVTGGVPATGGQGSGGKNAGGATGTGGAATGGNANSTGGRATGGASGAGGSAAGGSSGTGGSGSNGGTTGTPDASTSSYHPCPTDGTACKIMPFGDSITDGYNADTPGGYRVELFRLAHSAGKNITFVGSQTSWGTPKADGVDVPPKHEGHSGYTIYDAGGRKGIGEMVSTAMPAYTPHIVLLMIGTNDCIDNYQIATAPTRLKALIDSIYAQRPEVLIIVAQPIPSRGDASKGDKTDLSDRIKVYGDAIPAVVKAQADTGKHILLVDMFTPFNPKKASLLEDEWHPNLAGYVLLGAQWYSVLQSLL